MNQLDTEIAALTAQVATDTTVEGSAVKLIQGFAAQLAAAVAAAGANGATPTQLASLTDLGKTVETNSAALAAAVAANTVTPPVPVPVGP